MLMCVVPHNSVWLQSYGQSCPHTPHIMLLHTFSLIFYAATSMELHNPLLIRASLLWVFYTATRQL